MPDLLRGYGDLLRRGQDGSSVVFAVVAGIVLFPFATLLFGALFQGIARRCKHWRETRDKPRSGSESSPRDGI